MHRAIEDLRASWILARIPTPGDLLPAFELLDNEKQPVLSDPGNVYTKQLSLTFALPEDLREVYRTFGILLPDVNGDNSWELPLPTRMVVDEEGVIRKIDADPDYTHRPEPMETVEAP